METELKTELKERMKEEGKDLVVQVVNTEQGATLTSEYGSIEEALHKIELDLMTNLHFGFVRPIEVTIKEVKE